MKAMILLTLFLFCAAAGFADESVDSGKPKPKVVYKKSEEHQFSGSKLKGDLKKPELSYIYQRKGLRAERIVNVPENFDEEILAGTGQF